MSAALRNSILPIRLSPPVPQPFIPTFIQAELIDFVPAGHLAAVLCQAEDVDTIAPNLPTRYQSLADRIAFSRAAAEQARRPIFAYCDDGRGFIDHVAADLLIATDYIGWAFYWDAGESPAQRDARYRAALDDARARFPENKIVIVVGASTRGFLAPSDVAENIIACSQFAAEYRDVIAALWFADGRGQGPSEYPELVPYLDALMLGATQAPDTSPFPRPPDPPDPEPEPEPPKPEVVMLTVGLATPLAAAIVTAVPHPDAGYLALVNAEGKFLKLDPTTNPPSLSWSDNAGSWERFLDGGNVWIAPRDQGTWVLVKGSTL